MRSKKTWILLSLMLGSFFFGQGQNRNWDNPLHYQVEDGLPSSELYACFQDKEGFLWIASDHGVARWDGYEFETFDTRDGLSDNVIFRIYQDFEDKVWFSSIAGQLSYFHNGEIITPAYNPELAKMINPYFIIGEYRNTDGSILLGINGRGLVKIDSEGNIGREKTIPGELVFEFKNGNYIHHATFDNLKDVFIKVDVPNIKWERSFSYKKLKRSGIPSACYVDDKMGFVFGDSIYLVTPDTCLRAYSPDLDIFLHIIDDLLFVCYYKKGVDVFRIGEHQLEKLYTLLPEISVSGIYQDREKGVWMSTLEQGLYYYPDKPIGLYDRQDGLEEDYIVILEGGEPGEMLLAYRNGTLQWLKGRTFGEALSLKAILPADVSQYDKKTGVMKVLGSSSYEIRGDEVSVATSKYSVMNFDENGAFVVASKRDLFYEGSGGVEFLCNIEGFPLRQTRGFLDRSGRFWLGGLKGLFTTEKKEIVPFEPENPIFRWRVVEIENYKNFNLLLATRGAGLIFVKGKQGVKLGMEEGLVGDHVNKIFIDKDENIWVATNRGLSRVDGENFPQIQSFTTKNGLVSNEVTDVFVRNDTAWVGTKRGLNVIDLKSFRVSHVAPPIYITRIEVDHIEREMKGPKMVIKPRERFISIDFVGINFRSQGDIFYKTRLFPLEEEWTYSKNRNVQYSTLPPGDYRFEVYCQNEDGLLSSAPAVVLFKVKQAIYKSLWFWALAFLTLVLLIWLVIYRNYQRKNEKQGLQNKVMDLEKQALQAQMNPHFLFNSLNSLHGYIAMEKVEKAERYLVKFSRLVRLILESSRKSSISVADTISLLENYLSLEQMRFGTKLSYDIKVESGLEIDLMQIPSMLIQPFVENSVYHGIALKSSPGYVHICLTDKGEFLNVIVADNGVGRNKSREIRGSSETLHRSLGTQITEERLAILGSSGQGKVEIRDLYHSDGSPAGTEVEINIPIFTKT